VGNNKTTLPARIGASRLIRIVLDSGMGWDGMVITNPDLADSITLKSPMEASIGGAGNSGEATAVFSESIELLMKPGQKFNLPSETEDYYLGRSLSGDITGKKGKISKVIIGPYELGNVNAAFAPAEVRSKQKGADGVISNNLLRRFNLIFDYSNKMIYLKPNSFFLEPFK
jgi:hypothetical protein